MIDVQLIHSTLTPPSPRHLNHYMRRNVSSHPFRHHLEQMIIRLHHRRRVFAVLHVSNMRRRRQRCHCRLAVAVLLPQDIFSNNPVTITATTTHNRLTWFHKQVSRCRHRHHISLLLLLTCRHRCRRHDFFMMMMCQQQRKQPRMIDFTSFH